MDEMKILILIKSQILLMNPLPPMNNVLSKVLQHEGKVTN